MEECFVLALPARMTQLSGQFRCDTCLFAAVLHTSPATLDAWSQTSSHTDIREPWGNHSFKAGFQAQLCEL